MNRTVYIFSGLGADERVFKNLNFSGFQIVHVKWIIPELKETIEQYASRISQNITTPNPILIGYSFGGIMAVEVAKQIETEKIILIASAKTRKEIPSYYRFAGKLNLHRIVPARVLKRSNFLTNWFFGVRSIRDKQLLKQILTDTNPIFLKWAIDKIVRWGNISKPKNCIHIHGTNDRILPQRYSNSDISVKDGGHLMVLHKAQEISEIINKLLS